jgi:hypothetical protein
MNYYYANESGEAAGPCTAEQMRQLYRQGTLDENAWVIGEGEAEWKSYASLFLTVRKEGLRDGQPKRCARCGAESKDGGPLCEGCRAKPEAAPPSARASAPVVCQPELTQPETEPADAPPAAASGFQKHAFISHSSRDHGWAEQVCAVLEGHGLNCWLAPRDIDPGAPYDEEILRGIECSQTFILLLSDSANKSPHVKRELMCALRAGHSVYPIRIQEVQPGKKLEYLLEGIHWVDAWMPPIEAHLNRLAELIANADPNATSGPHVGKRRYFGGPLWQSRRSVTGITVAALAVILLGWAAVTWKSGVVSGIVSYLTQQVEARIKGIARAAPAAPEQAPAPAAARPEKARQKLFGAQTLTLNWSHDPNVEKRYPSSAQVLDGAGTAIGELSLDAATPEDSRWRGIYYHTVVLSFTNENAKNTVCVFREDDAAGQTRVGVVDGLSFSAQVTEIERFGEVNSVKSAVKTLTVEVTAGTPLPGDPRRDRAADAFGAKRAQEKQKSDSAPPLEKKVTRVDRLLILSWSADPKEAKRYPSSDQVLDVARDVLGDLNLVPSAGNSLVQLTFTGPLPEKETAVLCEFRSDDPVGQMRVGKAHGVSYSARVVEAKGQGTRDGKIEAITVEVGARR